MKRNVDGSLDWEPGENAFLIVDPTDSRAGEVVADSNVHFVRSVQFGD